ncbi:MAG: radical SAM family heme chaperone HemW [Thermoleophilia bacterium]
MEATDHPGLLVEASGAASSSASSAAPHGVTHLYVHLPFCRTRCGYCDFTSEVIGPHLRSGSLAAYVDAVRQELALVEPLVSRPLETVYVGGGTPTAVPPELLRDLLADLGRFVGSGTEFTVEANPENVDETTLGLLSSQGVTRLSLGVQSFLPSGLSALGRRTPSGATAQALDAIGRTGWQEWSLDLVFGMPGQDLPALEYDLEAAVAARPPHISVYDLTYTDHYARRLESQRGPHARETSEDFSETHYASVTERLCAAGYRRYEVSSYALPGHESRHNLGYWRGEDYLGLGATSVSTVGGMRWTHPGSVASYLAGAPAEVEMLSPAVQRFERAMLGLRTAEGVPEAVVSEAIDAEELRRCIELGLVQRCCATLRLSPRGLDLGNAVLAAILRSPE